MGRATRVLTLVAATMFCTGGALAQAIDVDQLSDADFKKLTPEQTKGLPALKVLGRFDPQLAAGMRAFVPLMLRDLGYGFREAFTGSDEQLQKWVAQFQKGPEARATG